MWFWPKLLPDSKDDLFPGVTAVIIVIVALWRSRWSKPSLHEASRSSPLGDCRSCLRDRTEPREHCHDARSRSMARIGVGSSAAHERSGSGPQHGVPVRRAPASAEDEDRRGAEAARSSRVLYRRHDRVGTLVLRSGPARRKARSFSIRCRIAGCWRCRVSISSACRPDSGCWGRCAWLSRRASRSRGWCQRAAGCALRRSLVLVGRLAARRMDERHQHGRGAATVAEGRTP